MITLNIDAGTFVALQNLTGADMLLDPAGIRIDVFTGTLRPISSDSSAFGFGDLVLPAYTGEDYAQGAVVSWTNTKQAGNAVAISNEISFTPTADNVLANSIMGYAISTDEESPKLIGVEVFETGAQTIVTPVTDVVAFHAKVKLSSNSDYGSAVVV